MRGAGRPRAAGRAALWWLHGQVARRAGAPQGSCAGCQKQTVSMRGGHHPPTALTVMPCLMTKSYAARRSYPGSAPPPAAPPEARAAAWHAME
jgi:hypothetical protein